MTDRIKDTTTAESITNIADSVAREVEANSSGFQNNTTHYIVVAVVRAINQYTTSLLADKDKEIERLQEIETKESDLRISFNHLSEVFKDIDNERIHLRSLNTLAEQRAEQAEANLLAREEQLRERTRALKDAEAEVRRLTILYQNAGEQLDQWVKNAKQAEAKVAGLVEAIETVLPWAGNCADMVKNGEIVRQCSDGTVMRFKEHGWFEDPVATLEQALTDAQPLVIERDKRVIQMCIDAIAEARPTTSLKRIMTKGECTSYGFAKADVIEALEALKNKQGG